MKMRICIHCGVELDNDFEICPLCGKHPENDSKPESLSVNYPSDIITLQKKETRKYFWELSGIIAFSGIAVCTIVDLLISKGLSWSLLSDVSIMAFWVMMTLFFYFHKRTLILMPGLMFTLLGTLFLIDQTESGQNWFFPVGLPITIAAFITAGIIMVLWRMAHFKGMNILAAALIVLSGFCVIAEMVLDEYLNGVVDLRWSLIAAISILPVALIFSFYHYRLKKGNRLESFFHV